MKTKPLSKTNLYLRNSEQRAEMIRMHVITSSAIEGVNIGYSHKKAEFVSKKSGKSIPHKS